MTTNAWSFSASLTKTARSIGSRDEVDGQFCKPNNYALQLVFLRFSRRLLKFYDFEIDGLLSIDPLYQTSFIRRSEVCSEDLVSLD